MDTPETPLQLEEALKMYPNLSIKRWAIGNVTIWERLVGDSEREISLRLFQNMDTHEWDSIHIETKTTPQLVNDNDREKDTFVRVKSEEGGISLSVRDRGESHDPIEVIDTVKKGLDLLDAFVHADEKLKDKYKDRIQDDAANAEERFAPFPEIAAELEFAKELREMSVTTEDKDPQPRERYKLMKKMLQKPIIPTGKT